jgi:hypothetical protein
MRALQTVARGGITVVAVIHQPRYDIFQLLDDTLLLGKGGRTVYMGPTAGGLAYFEGLGFVCPQHVNPPDFFLDVMAGCVQSQSGGQVDLFAGWQSHALSTADHYALVDDADSIQRTPQDLLASSSPRGFDLHFALGLLLGLFVGFGAIFAASRPPSRSLRYGTAIGTLGTLLCGAFGYSLASLEQLVHFHDIKLAGNYTFLIFLLLSSLAAFALCAKAVRDYRRQQDGTFLFYAVVGFTGLGPLGALYCFTIQKISSLKARAAIVFGFGLQLLVAGISIVFSFYILWIGSPYTDTRCAPHCNLVLYLGITFIVAECIIVFVFARRYRRLPTHDRRTMGWIAQTFLCAHRGLLQLLRDVPGLIFEYGLVAMSGLFLGLIFYKMPFVGPLPTAVQAQCPAAARELCAMPLDDPVLSEVSLVCLALSLAAVTASQRIFGREKASFVRESMSGLSTEAYYVGKSLSHLSSTFIAPLVMLAVFYPLTNLQSSFVMLYLLLVLVHATASGAAYLTSILFSDTVAALSGVLFVLVSMMFSGANPTLDQLRGGVMGGALYYPTFASYIRWAQEAFYIAEMNVRDGPELDAVLSLHSYARDNETQAWVVLCVHAIALRVLAYLACVLREP